MASETEIIEITLNQGLHAEGLKKIQLYKKPGIYLVGKFQRKRKTYLSYLIIA